MRPYRSNVGLTPALGADPPGDRDLVIPAAVVWLFCALRVVSALVRGEVFGASATLALLVVVVVAMLAARCAAMRARS